MFASAIAATNARTRAVGRLRSDRRMTGKTGAQSSGVKNFQLGPVRLAAFPPPSRSRSISRVIRAHLSLAFSTPAIVLYGWRTHVRHSRPRRG